MRRILLSEAYDFCPLPLYDINSTIVAPSSYHTNLPGSLVHVELRITHEYSSRDHTDDFYADIKKIQILAHPHI